MEALCADKGKDLLLENHAWGFASEVYSAEKTYWYY
jgi:hypothetical protein